MIGLEWQILGSCVEASLISGSPHYSSSLNNISQIISVTGEMDPSGGSVPPAGPNITGEMEPGTNTNI